MTKVKKISRDTLRKVCASAEAGPSAEDQDEMAIPSYLHPNPLVRWIVWRRHALIVELGGFDKGMEILDFGCGPGVFLPTLCSTGARVHAIDLFPEIAQRLCELEQLDVTFHDDIESLRDDSLDVIIAAEVLEHIDDGLDDLLTLFSSKLKENGHLLVSVPVEGTLYRLGRFTAGFGNKGDYHHHKGEDIFTKISSMGFNEQRRRGIPLNVMPSFYLVGMFLNRKEDREIPQ